MLKSSISARDMNGTQRETQRNMEEEAPKKAIRVSDCERFAPLYQHHWSSASKCGTHAIFGEWIFHLIDVLVLILPNNSS